MIENDKQSTGAYEFDGNNLKTLMDSGGQANATSGVQQALRDVVGKTEMQDSIPASKTSDVKTYHTPNIASSQK